MDLQGIEPWTTPMLREYYTTKPQAQLDEMRANFRLHEPIYCTPTTRLACHVTLSMILQNTTANRFNIASEDNHFTIGYY